MNKALRALLIYNGIFVLAGSLLGPLYTVYVQHITTSVVILSFSSGIFLISTTLCIFVVSLFGDKVRDKKYLLLAGFLVRAIVWFLFIFVNSVFFLIVLQIVLGVGEALGSPAFGSLMAEHLDKGRHIEDFSDMTIVFNLSGALATILGGFMVARYGFPALFVTMSALAFIAFFGLVIQPKRLFK